MSLKAVIMTLLTMIVCCYCENITLNEELTVDEGRAKRKKSNLRIWGVLLLLIVGKLAVEKLLAVFVVWGSFQKFCYLAGLAISYFMSKPSQPARPSKPPGAEPVSTDYNTLGYSYEPPDSFSDVEHVAGTAGSHGALLNNWPYNRRSLSNE